MTISWTEQIAVTIAGTDRTANVKRGTLTVEAVAATRAVSTRTCKFAVTDGGAIGLEKMQVVVVSDSTGATRYFAGFITDLTEKQIGASRLEYDVTCEGYVWQLGFPEDLYDGDFSSETDATVLQTVLATTNPEIDTSTYVETVDDGVSMDFDYVTGLDAVQKIAEKTGAVWYVDDGPADMAQSGAAEKLYNTGFEIAGTGGADIWAGWVETAGDGAIADETTLVHGGSHAARLTAGTNRNTIMTRACAVLPGRRHQLSLWTRGDGTYGGWYRLYDLTNAAWIIPATDTGVTGTDYAEVTQYFTAPAGCVAVQVRLMCAGTAGGIAYFDDVSVKEACQVRLHYFLSPLDDRSELASNGGFEVAGGGGADVYDTWAETAGDGAIADETSAVYAGAHAAKLTAGATANTMITQAITVLPERDYKLTFYSRGDGTHQGRYRLYDLTNSAFIIATANTGVTGTDYALVDESFTTPAGCVSAQVRLMCPATNTGVAYFDAVSVRREYAAEWALLADTFRSDGAYYTDLECISKAPEANRVIVRGAGTILRTVTSGSESDYGRWITCLHTDKSIASNDEADAVGAAILAQKASQPSYRCKTWRHGLFAGQVVKLTNSARSLASEELDIKRVTYAWDGRKADSATWIVSCDLELGKFLPRLPDVLAEAGGAASKMDDLEWEYDKHTHTNPDTGNESAHTHTQDSTGSESAHTHTQDSTGNESAHTHTQGKTGNESAHTHTQADTGSAGAHTHLMTWDYASAQHCHSIAGYVEVGGSTYAIVLTHVSTEVGYCFIRLNNFVVGGGSSASVASNGAHTHTNPATAAGSAHAHTNPATAAGSAHAHTNPATAAGSAHAHTNPTTAAGSTHKHTQGATGGPS